MGREGKATRGWRHGDLMDCSRGLTAFQKVTSTNRSTRPIYINRSSCPKHTVAICMVTTASVSVMSGSGATCHGTGLVWLLCSVDSWTCCTCMDALQHLRYFVWRETTRFSSRTVVLTLVSPRYPSNHKNTCFRSNGCTFLKWLDQSTCINILHRTLYLVCKNSTCSSLRSTILTSVSTYIPSNRKIARSRSIWCVFPMSLDQLLYIHLLHYPLHSGNVLYLLSSTRYCYLLGDN